MECRQLSVISFQSEILLEAENLGSKTSSTLIENRQSKIGNSSPMPLGKLRERLKLGARGAGIQNLACLRHALLEILCLSRQSQGRRRIG